MTDTVSAGELVSVIIPTYNAAGFIAETLTSALAQNHRAIEVIVVDDGSIDRTAEIVEALASRDNRVRLLRQPNRGVAAARNLGIAHSRGAFIAPLDADDVWHPDKIAMQMQAMREGQPRVAMVYSWSSTIDMTGRVLVRDAGVASYEGDVYPFLVMHNFLGNGSTPLLRRDCVLDAGGYDPDLRARGGEGVEDLLLYLRIAEKHEVALVREFLVAYRVHPSSMSSNIRRMKRGHDLLLQMIRVQHPELPSRLFRWSDAITCFYLGRRSLQNGRWLLASLLLARVLVRDPAFICEPRFRSAVTKIAATLTRRPDRTYRGLVRGFVFLDLPTKPELPVVPESSGFSQRRHGFLQSLCRPGAGSRRVGGGE